MMEIITYTTNKEHNEHVFVDDFLSIPRCIIIDKKTKIYTRIDINAAHNPPDIVVKHAVKLPMEHHWGKFWMFAPKITRDGIIVRLIFVTGEKGFNIHVVSEIDHLTKKVRYYSFHFADEKQELSSDSMLNRLTVKCDNEIYYSPYYYVVDGNNLIIKNISPVFDYDYEMKILEGNTILFESFIVSDKSMIIL